MADVCTHWAGRCAEGIRRFFPPLFLAMLLSPLAAGANFPQAELECEEAAAHLDACCPDFDPGTQLRCKFIYQEGCGDSTYPDLGVEESQCIREMSCSEVRERGLCDIRGKEDGEGRWVSGFDGGATCS